MITFRNGARAQRGEIGAGLRLGKIHRAGPIAGDHFVQIALFYFRRRAELNRLDRTLRQQWAQRKRQVRRTEHFLHRRGDQGGKLLSAVFRVAAQLIPAALDELAIGLFKTIRRCHRAVTPFRTLLIAAPIQRREHIAGKLARLVQNGVDQVRRHFFATRQRRNRAEADQFMQHKLHVLSRGRVAHDLSSSAMNSGMA